MMWHATQSSCFFRNTVDWPRYPSAGSVQHGSRTSILCVLDAIPVRTAAARVEVEARRMEFVARIILSFQSVKIVRGEISSEELVRLSVQS